MSASSPPSVYHVSPMRQTLFLLPWGLIAVPMLIGGIVANVPGLFAVVVIISLIWAPLAYAVCIYTRLIVSADGVDLRQLGYRLQSTWDNIEALDRTRLHEGFVLRQPMEGKGAIRLANASGVRIVVSGAAMPAYAGGRQDLVAQLRFIPIEPFAYWLKNGDLAGVIAQHAPRLMDGSTPPPPAPVADAPMSTRTKLILGIVIAASIALGVAMATGMLDPAFQIWMQRILRGTTGTALGIYGVFNLSLIWAHARQRKWGWAGVSLMFAILTLCGMLVAFTSMP